MLVWYIKLIVQNILKKNRAQKMKKELRKIIYLGAYAFLYAYVYVATSNASGAFFSNVDYFVSYKICDAQSL